MMDVIADGLWRRLRDAALAEERLEAFAFFPDEPAPARVRRLATLAADSTALAALARDVTLRALAAAADGVNYRLLAGLGGQPVAIDALARTTALPALAVSERVGALAQAGLATRTLEQDAVAATEAGRGLIALIDGISAALVERCRGGLT